MTHFFSLHKFNNPTVTQFFFAFVLLVIFHPFGKSSHNFYRNLLFLPPICHGNVITVFLFNRMLVYEFVNNGNLEQWLHGAMCQRGVFSWENRMKVVTGTAKA